MRTLSAQQIIINGLPSRSHWARVRIDRTGSMDWVDLSNYEGYNWILSVDYGASVDDPCMSAIIHFKKRVQALNLSPFDDNSKLNQGGTLVDLAQEIIIETATLGTDKQPVSTEWKEVFHGYISMVDWSGNSIEVRCRDEAAIPIDHFIDTQREYGPGGLENVIQALLDDNLGGGAVNLYSVNGTLGTPFNPGDSPGWSLSTYVQAKMSLMEAIKRLADMIGWTVRYTWQANRGQFELVLYEPDRAKSTPDFEFTVSKYVKVTRLSLDIAGIRNKIKVVYTSTTGVRSSYLYTNAASVAKYGTRYMEIAEDGSSQIDTVSEAQDMATACGLDICEPDVFKGVSMPYFWPVELGDLYRYVADYINYTSNQDLAVTSFRHRFTSKKSTTTLQCRGQPSGGFKRWLEIETRFGLAPPNKIYTHDAPSGVSLAAGLGGLIIEFDDPRFVSPKVKDWSTSRVFVSTQSGFDPGVPAQYQFYAEGRQTRFEFAGLIPGETFYVKIRHYDSSGNISATSAQVTKATALVGPFHQNLDTENGSIIPNSDFNVWSPPFDDKTAYPPDVWKCIKKSGGVYVEDAALWGVGNEVYYEDTTQETGTYAIKLMADNGATDDPGVGIVDLAKFLPVTGRTLYVADWNIRTSIAAAQLYVAHRFYAKDKVTTKGILARTGVLPTGAGVWYREVAAYETDVLARYMSPIAVQDDSVGPPSGIAYVDRISLIRSLPSFHAYRFNSVQVVATGATIQFNAESHDHGDNYDDPNYWFLAPNDGDYQFNAGVQMEALGSQKCCQLRFYIDTGGGFAEYNRGVNNCNGAGAPANVQTTISIISVYLARGDKIRVNVFHDHGGNRNITNGSNYTYFNGSQYK